MGTSGQAPPAGTRPPDRRKDHGRLPRQSRYWPPNWPIRWKLTVLSAGLTFVILLTFGAAISQLATSELRDNFAADTTAKAKELADRLQQEGLTVTPGGAGPPSQLDSFLKSGNGVVMLITSGGFMYGREGFPDAGPGDQSTGVASSGGYQIATAPIFDRRQSTVPVGWIRYGRPVDLLDESINRVRFSIFGGIAAATLLAALGAAVLSRRAMRPISSLTSTARKIANTRDPEVRLEPPVSDDEVAELTRTFSEMLRELSLSREEEERLMRRQREFIADASHELRTPLTSVLANLELLEASLRRAGRDDDVESVESALRSSQRMRRLVGDLQLLARIDVLREAGFSACDLGTIARDAASELEPLAGGSRIHIVAEHPVPVQGSGDELHRVAVNLIGNAIRHVPDGRRIEVRAQADRESGKALLIVEDDGPGIPDGLRPEIFDRFVRGTGPLDRSGGTGTGLGLAIVKAISERHGGTVEVAESTLGGARFTVTLPLDAAPAKAGSRS